MPGDYLPLAPGHRESPGWVKLVLALGSPAQRGHLLINSLICVDLLSTGRTLNWLKRDLSFSSAKLLQP